MRMRLLLCLMGVALLCRSRDLAATPEFDSSSQVDPFIEAVGFWAIDDPGPWRQCMFDFEFDGKTVFTRLAFDGGCANGDWRRRVEAKWIGNRLHMRVGESWVHLATFQNGRFLIDGQTSVLTYTRTNAASRLYWTSETPP